MFIACFNFPKLLKNFFVKTMSSQIPRQERHQCRVLLVTVKNVVNAVLLKIGLSKEKPFLGITQKRYVLELRNNAVFKKSVGFQLKSEDIFVC